jgi:hypothetical protein
MARWLRFGRAVGVLALLCQVSCLAGQTSLEYQVKAAYLYNFAKFVTWPAGENTGAMTICVMGRDPFGPILDDAVRGKSVRGQPIAIRRLPKNAQPQGCQIVFADFGEGVCQSHTAQANWGGILLVGEGDQFTRCGGMIGLILKEGRVQFAINVEAVTRAHLEVSSKLLQVASVVSMDKRK